MATIVTRLGKGSALTWEEADANIVNLNDTKIEAEGAGTEGQVLTKTATGANWVDAGDFGFTGSVGFTGSQGATGYTGSQGEIGFTGSQGANGVDALWNFTGTYSGGVSYAIGDVATYNGETWYRINSNGGNVGDTPVEGAFWTLIAQKGNQGDIGFTGSQGEIGFTGSQGSGGLAAVVDDLAPQLGGALDTNGFAINGYNTTLTGSNSVVLQGGAADSIALGGAGVSIKANGEVTKIVLQETGGFGNITVTANGDIDINTTSMLKLDSPQVRINNLYYPYADGTTGQVLTTDGAGLLSWSTPTGITALVDDPAPMLGNDLNVDNNVIFGSRVTIEAENPNTSTGSYARTRIKSQFFGDDPEATYSETTISTRDGLADQFITVKGANYDSLGQIVQNGFISIVGNISLNSLVYPTVDGTSGQVLSTDGAGVLSWTTASAELVNDTTPQLGGNLDVNGYSVTGAQVLLQSNVYPTNHTAPYTVLGGTNSNSYVEVGVNGASISVIGTQIDPETQAVVVPSSITSVSKQFSFATTDNASIITMVAETSPGNLDSDISISSGNIDIDGFNTVNINNNNAALTMSGGNVNLVGSGGGEVRLYDSSSGAARVVLTSQSSPGANDQMVDIVAPTVKINTLTYPNADGTVGQILTTNGAGILSWNNPSSISLNEITDVIITDAVINDVLLYDGTNWVNNPVLGDINAALIAINGV